MPLGTASMGGAAGSGAGSASTGAVAGATAQSDGAGAGGRAGSSSMNLGGAGTGGSSAGGTSSGGAGASSLGGSTSPGGGPGSVLCIPTSEVCDGADNDCDGLVDEGCPPTIGWDITAKDAFLGGSEGGLDFSETCAAGEVLAGVNVTVGDWVEAVQAVCKKPTFMGPNKVVLGEAHTLTQHPVNTTDGNQNLICAGNGVVVGMRAQQMPYVAADVTHIVTAALWITCAEPTLSLGSATPTAGWLTSTEIGPAASGWNGTSTATLSATDQLTSPKVVVGLYGNAGQWVDRVGLLSANLTFTVNPQN